MKGDIINREIELQNIEILLKYFIKIQASITNATFIINSMSLGGKFNVNNPTGLKTSLAHITSELLYRC